MSSSKVAGKCESIIRIICIQAAGWTLQAKRDGSALYWSSLLFSC
jgi:hypothetical protein